MLDSAPFRLRPGLRSEASSRGALIVVAAIVTLGFAMVLLSDWPGVMIDDARWQYQQAVDNRFEDWHPPLMAWIWRRLMIVAPGPAPIFVLQLALYWAGIGLIAGAAHRSGRPRLAIGVALTGFIPAPFALTGTITKDCLMTGLLGCAVGLMLWRDVVRSQPARPLLSVATLLFLLGAAALRFNAFLACLPLALAALPARLVATKGRMATMSLIATALFLAAGPAASGLLRAEKTDVKLSLIMFDLAGITEHSGQSQFPEMGVARPVAVIHGCYDPLQWDSFSDWAKTPCPIDFDGFRAAVRAQHLAPIALWIRAIAAHPIAYAEHRFAHFNLSTWFLVRSGPSFTAWSQSVPNPWNYRVRDTAGPDGIRRLADIAALTPVGWPIFWLALSLAAAIIAWSARAGRTLVAIAASPLLYGTGYLVFGVATGMRYHMWTIVGGAIAVILAIGCVKRATPSGRAAAASAVVIPTMLACLARFVLA